MVALKKRLADFNVISVDSKIEDPDHGVFGCAATEQVIVTYDKSVSQWETLVGVRIPQNGVVLGARARDKGFCSLLVDLHLLLLYNYFI